MGLRDRNILSLLEDRTNNYGERVALGIKNALGWREFTYKGIGLMSRKLAYHLINEAGVEKGDRIAILSESKPEYGACVFASILAGATIVPLDVKLTKYELNSILSDCQPKVVLVSQHYLETAIALKKELPSIETILVMDEPSFNMQYTSIYELPNKYDGKWRKRSSKATVFIIYTSGTTGAPKGVEISFTNMFSQLEDLKVVLDKILPVEHGRILSILPMNHLFEMTVGFSTFLNFGHSVYYTQSLKPKDILSIMREKQINFMIVVPAFLKLLKTSIEADLHNASPAEQTAFKWLYHAAKFVPCSTIRKLMFKKIHDQFGGHFIGCLSGGAPLDLHVGKFFDRIGLKLYQAYGLSEASPVVSVNTDKRWELASVGRAMNSFTVKTDESTGELLIKGPAVMKGYHNQEELTKTVIDEDGWLHSGDIAEIDKDGHIFITGRIKNMIVLSGGKKVFPEEVESVLEKSEYVSEICVLGIPRTFGAKDGTEEIAAVVVPKDYLYDKYSDEELDKLIKADIKHLSTRLTAYKRPVNIVVTKNPLPRTATRKVKRKEVKQLVTA